jgi:hypothetical protein
MTDKEINEAICKAQGWTSQTRIQFDTGYEWTKVQTFWYNAAGKQSKVPDYCNDLNAMREAELEIQGADNWNKYTDILGKLCHYKPNIHCLRSFANIIVSAKAQQRAEAFLKTYGKWKERAKPI